MTPDARAADAVDAMETLAAARHDFVQCHFPEAVQGAKSVLAQPGLPDQLYQSAELMCLIGLVTERDLRGAQNRAEAILAGGDRQAEDDSALIGALTTMAFVARDEGRMSDALGLLRTVTARANTASRDGRNNYARLCLAAMLTSIGEFSEAERVIAQCRVEIELTGDNMWAAAPSIARACLYLSAGRLDDAAEEAEVARVIASGLGHEFFVLVTECVQALIALRRGDVPEAAERMDRCAARIPSSSGAVDPASYSWTRAHVAAAQGDAAGALQALAFPHDGVPTHDWLLVELPAEVAWSVRTALKAEATEQAEALVAHAEDAAARNPELTTIVASALHARGLLDRDSEALVQAAAKEVHPWQRGSAHEDEGVILAEAHRDGARAALERACGAYEEAGAMGDADRVRERLRDLLHTGRRRHDERPRWGWSSLTPTEREVARNVAEGLTNARVGEKMFLSRHTVDFHLRQIYRKLDITSRVELTRLVLKYEGDSPVTPSPYSKQP